MKHYRNGPVAKMVQQQLEYIYSNKSAKLLIHVELSRKPLPLLIPHGEISSILLLFHMLCVRVLAVESIQLTSTALLYTKASGYNRSKAGEYSKLLRSLIYSLLLHSV